MHLVFILLTIGSMAQAGEWRSRNSTEIGTTNNANLTSSDRISDSFYRVSTSNATTDGDHQWGVRLSYKDYTKENNNDLFSLRASDVWHPSDSQFKYTGAFSAQVYPAGSSGTNDTAFDNYGLDLGFRRSGEDPKSFSINYGANSRTRIYPSISGRADEDLTGALEAESELDKKLTISIELESGVLISSLPEYSKLHVELGGAMEYELPRSWYLSADALLSQNYFLNRKFSTTTAVTKNRRSVVAEEVSSRENHRIFTFGSEIGQRVTPSFEFGFGLNSVNQSSASGLENYSELQLLGHITLIF